MAIARVLVVYGSSYGQTAKIAHRIGEVLQRSGLAIDLCDAAASRPSLGPDQYDAVVVGCSLIARGHQASVKKFVVDNIGQLNRIPSAFFLVSASAGSASAKGRAAAEQRLGEFLVGTGWAPRLTASIAGAINYTKYNVLLRWYMKRASAKHGGSTDTSRDHEYTDWNQVERFAADIAIMVTRSGAVSAPRTPEVATHTAGA